MRKKKAINNSMSLVMADITELAEEVRAARLILKASQRRLGLERRRFRRLHKKYQEAQS